MIGVTIRKRSGLQAMVRAASILEISFNGGEGTGSAYSEECAVGLKVASVGDQISPCL
jgi:hypothetical protein